MKFSDLALTAALGCALFVGDAAAQGLRQPSSVQRTGFAYDYYSQEDAQASPSDLVPRAREAGPAEAAVGSGVYAPLGTSGCDPCCDEPWRLFPEVGCGWNLTGWVNGGVTANASNPNSRFNGPVTFNDRNEGQLNQLYAVLERETNTCGYGWDIGGRIDLLYGTDYIFTQSQGLELDPDGSPGWNRERFYGLAMPQAYGEVAYNNLKVKLGHFYRILGNESVMAPNNFFYSRAYTMQYGEPFTHTGGLATWDYSDTLTFNSGIVNGWDRFDGISDRAAYISGTTYTPTHGRYALNLSYITGDEFNNNNRLTNRTLYSLLFNYNVSDNLSYLLQHDHGWQDDYFASGRDSEWYGINQYLTYRINDCWAAGSRFEWFRDDDGVRVAGVRAGNPTANSSFAGHFYELTAGLNWTPTSNFRMRPEIRWDWYDGPASATGAALPFDDGNKDDQFTAAVDAILLW